MFNNFLGGVLLGSLMGTPNIQGQPGAFPLYHVDNNWSSQQRAQQLNLLHASAGCNWTDHITHNSRDTWSYAEQIEVVRLKNEVDILSTYWREPHLLLRRSVSFWGVLIFILLITILPIVILPMVPLLFYVIMFLLTFLYCYVATKLCKRRTLKKVNKNRSKLWGYLL